MSKKSFSFYRTDKPEPVEFELNGETIGCQPEIQGMDLLMFVAAIDQDNPAAGAKAVLDFLRKAILPEDWDRFVKTANAPQSGVGPEALSEISGYLSEVYTKRPTPSS